MRYVLFVLISAIFFGCAATKKEIAEQGKSEVVETAQYDESFDPLTLNDDDIDIVAAKTEESTSEAADISIPEDETPNGEMQQRSGFRVQIIATQNIESATLAQQRAAEEFGTMNHQAYLVYEAPQFKIRIGDVLTRGDAEEIRDLARDFGYKGAFIVRSEVTVPVEQ